MTRMKTTKSKNQTTLEDLRDLILKVDAKVVKVDAKVGDLNTKVEDLNTKVGDLDKKVESSIEQLAVSTANSFKEVNRRLDIMENRIGGVEIGVGQINYKMNGVGSRIDDLSDNRVKYSDFDPVKKDVAILKTSLVARNKKPNGA